MIFRLQHRHAWILAVGAASTLAALVSSAGCSSSDEANPPVPVPEAGSDVPLIPPPPDAGIACDPKKPFDTPVLVKGLPTGTKKAAGGRLSPDELTIVYDDGLDLTLATRPDRDSAFETKPWLAATNSTYAEYSPWLTADTQTLYFVSNRNSSGIFGLYRAQRADTGAAFGAAQEILRLSAGDLYEPYMREGVDLWMSPGGNNRAIQRAAITGDAFGPASPVAELDDAAAADRSPVITPDGLTIYFMSNRAGGQGLDVWMATREADPGTFGKPVLAAGVNSAFTDEPLWVSRDGCRLYVASDRPETDGGTKQEAHIFLAQRPQ